MRYNLAETRDNGGEREGQSNRDKGQRGLTRGSKEDNLLPITWLSAICGNVRLDN